jgi:predicted P-loop ATPase
MLLTLTTSQFEPLNLEEAELSSDELGELLTVYEVGEKDGAAVIPALFGECPSTCYRVGTRGDCGGGAAHRLANNVRAMTGFAADIDDVTEAAMQGVLSHLQGLGVEFFAWETHSHDPAAVAQGEAVGRYRLLVPFAVAMELKNPEQWSKGAWPRLVRHFGLDGLARADGMCKDPSRLYYLPRKPDEAAEREGGHVEGVPFYWPSVVGDLDSLIPPVAVVAPRKSSDSEDPTRTVDLDALRARLKDTRNPVTRELAERAVKGELLTTLPHEREPGDLSRHEAWWLLTGRLSIVAEPWMSTEALWELLKPSWRTEADASPTDYTEWDGDRDSIVEMLDAQRATAPTRRAQIQAERSAKNAVARSGLNLMLARRGRPALPEAVEEGEADEEESHAAPNDAPDEASEPEVHAEDEAPWTVEELTSAMDVKHGATGAVTYPGTFKNIVLVLSRAPEWTGVFRLNKLKQQQEVWPVGQFEGLLDKPRVFSETVITQVRLMLELSEHYPMRSERENVRQAAEFIAEQNPYEPVMNYLNGLTWDGVKRLDTWLEKYMHASTEADDGTDLRPYLAAIGKRWMISGAARGLDPGCKADSMLQIEGEQGAKKSTALAVLGGEFYTEGALNFEHRDTPLILTTSWVVELGEQASFDRASEAVQKAFLGRLTDTIVPKYSNYRTDLPRRCIFAATTNQEEYLTDVTGNRRHWTVSVSGTIDTDALRRDRDLLWAEAVVLYRAGEQWHLLDSEKALAKSEAAKRVRTEILDDLIEAWFLRRAPERRPKGILPVDVVRDVLEDNSGKTKKGTITAALKRLGFVNKVLWVKSASAKRWATPERLLKAPMESRTREEAIEAIVRKPTSGSSAQGEKVPEGLADQKEIG